MKQSAFGAGLTNMPKRENDPIETDKPDVDEDDAMLEEPKDDAFEDDDTSNVSE